MIGRSTLGKQQNTHFGLLGNTPEKKERRKRATMSIGVRYVCVFFLARMIEKSSATISSDVQYRNG